MFTVVQLSNEEIQCACNAYSKAHAIAVALRERSSNTEHYEVRRGDEIIFGTRGGRTYA